MPISLVDPNSTYELALPQDPSVVFTVKHWLNGMQDALDRACLIYRGPNDFSYDTAKDREMTIDLSVVAWRGVEFNGASAECTSENKKMLPIGVILWLYREIEERAGRRITEAEKKN